MHSIFRWTTALLLALGVALTAHADDTAAQIRQHAGEHRLLVLGEFHGTRETPLLVRQLVDDYSRNGPVLLALELPRAENPVLRDYLESDGGATARRHLRGRAFWTVRDDQHDGRRSRDMLAMIEGLRVLKAQGRVIEVVGYDVNASSGGNQARDDFMAAELRRLYRGLPDNARMLVLTGNVHAMLRRPAAGNAEAADGLPAAGPGYLQRAVGCAAWPGVGVRGPLHGAATSRAGGPAAAGRYPCGTGVRPVGVDAGAERRHARGSVASGNPSTHGVDLLVVHAIRGLE